MTSAIRLEKNATSVRLTLHKPEGKAHVSWTMRVQTIPLRPDVCQISLLLARRFLPSRHLVHRAPDESGDPFLSASLLHF
jgi:hypothetical protein